MNGNQSQSEEIEISIYTKFDKILILSKKCFEILRYESFKKIDD